MTSGRIGSSPELRRLGLLGILNPGVSYALSLAGLAQITASTSVLLWAVEPLLILALAYLIVKDHVSLPLAGCAAVAFGGVILVVFQPGAQATATGVALTVAGVAACAAYTVMSSTLLAEASTLSVVAAQQAAAFGFSLVLFGLWFLGGNPRSLAGVSTTAWISAIIAGVLYYAVAFWFYVAGLRGMRPGVAGMYINLIPVFGLTASFLLLDERMTARQWLGATIILTSVTTIARLQSPAAVPEPDIAVP